MNVSEWQDRLEKYFNENGIIGGTYLLDIINQESEYGEYIENRFIGHRVLIDSFFNFFVETIKKANNIVKTKGWHSNYRNYATTILYYITIFRRFRAAENLLIKGYPLDGYSLLRDIKDRSILLAAIVHGITSLSKIFGFECNEFNNKIFTKEDHIKLKSKRKKEEIRIFNAMIRNRSGLSSEIRSELKIWENLFHDEVHGSRLTFAIELLRWTKDKEPLNIGPCPVESTYTMYLNRSSEIGWLLVRLLPFLQIEPNVFGKKWTEKWNVLDDSFRFMIGGLDSIGKKIAKAFISFIDIKFPFNPEICYHENYDSKHNKKHNTTNITIDST